MAHARRVDQNLEEIVKAARKCGFLVYVRNDPLGDLDLCLMGRTLVAEVKGKAGRYTEFQAKKRKEGWVIHTLRTVEDVVKLREGVIREALGSGGPVGSG